MDLTSDGQTVYSADLSQFTEDIKAYGQKRAASSKYISFGLEQYGKIRLDERHDLVLTHFSANYDSEKDELEYLNIDGYLLER